MDNNLLNKLKNKTAKVGIIGLGYVGLPLLIEFAKKGVSVTGFDVDKTKCENLNGGKSYIKHISSDLIKKYQSNISATADFNELSAVDAVLICVPTPLNKYREPDISYVVSSTEVIADNLREGQLVILESTTYPGTTDEVMLPILEKGGLKAGVDFHLAYSPEREDPNNKDFTTSTIPKVIGGLTPKCLEAALSLYGLIIDETVAVSSTRVAESSKLLENIYRSVNIALVNELKVLFDRMDIDVWEVINASKTKPFGFQAFYPGPGLGGHCIPIDPFYLTWKAREYDFNTKFIELAGEINTSMPYYVIEKVFEALNRHNKSIKGSNILVLGLSYKKDIDDPRESPSFKLIELLESQGAEVSYHDPYIEKSPAMRHYNVKKDSTDLTVQNLKAFDCVLLSTDHSNFDYQFVYDNSNLIVDTRNAFSHIDDKANKIIKS